MDLQSKRAAGKNMNEKPIPFDELKTTTRTLMCYPTYHSFVRDKIFRNLEVIERDSRLDGKIIDKKKFTTNYGDIYSIQHGSRLRGLDFRKKKKRWCPICQLTKKKGTKNVKVTTIENILVQENIFHDFFESDVHKKYVTNFLLCLKLIDKKEYMSLVTIGNNEDILDLAQLLTRWEKSTSAIVKKFEEENFNITKLQEQFIFKIICLNENLKFQPLIQSESKMYESLKLNKHGCRLLKILKILTYDERELEYPPVSRTKFLNLMGISNPDQILNQKNKMFDPLKNIIELYNVFPDGLTDTRIIKYFCLKCEKYSTASDLKAINGFLNQITIILSIGEMLLNIMMFDNSIKIVGCKNDDDATIAVMILWEEYIQNDPETWKYLPKYTSEDIRTERVYPEFIFNLVMRNIQNGLGFSLDREKLNELLNRVEYSDTIFMSQCETTGQTNVNLKMYAKKPDNFTYYCLYYKGGKNYSKRVDECPRIKIGKAEEYVTFIIFTSSKTILSGKYEENMREMYYYFTDIIFQNKEYITEKLSKPKSNIIDHLFSLGFPDQIPFGK
ncbi:hypothetical protein OAG24_00255 [bacterium]|nr:hypothetical protein [bacterium]